MNYEVGNLVAGLPAAWAGFLQTRLERRHTLLVAALITAVPFGFILDQNRALRFQRQGPGGVPAYDEQLRRIAAGVRSVG